MATQISELASIHPDAKIGSNVIIEAFTTVHADVEIGDETRVGPNVTIFDGARIGAGCKIFPGAVISAISQDLKYKNEYTTVEIGNNTTIRECVTIHRGTADRYKTVVGNNCLLMNYVHIAHDCVVGDNVIIAGFTGLAGHCVVEDWAIIEGQVGVQQFVTIGAHAFIAGRCGVRKNVPPFCKAAREPLSYVGVNSIGLKRRGFSDVQIANIEDAYRVIYVQNSNIATALKVAEMELPSSDVKNQIINFIRSSTNGIMRGLS